MLQASRAARHERCPTLERAPSSHGPARSWVEPVSQRLDDGLMPLRATSTPAIANGEFAGRQRRLRDVLEAVPFTELLYDGLQ